MPEQSSATGGRVVTKKATRVVRPFQAVGGVTQTTVSATDLDIRDLVSATDSVTVGNAAASGVYVRPGTSAVFQTQSNSANISTETTLSAINAKLVTGTDIGDVTINNASGAAAVNIQDGGNSITIDGNVGIQGYRSSDTTYQPLRLDKATNTIQTIDYEHHEIHAGSHFFYMDYDSDVDTAAPKYYRITTPNTTTWSHITFIMYSEGVGSWQLFENPTVNAAGTTATVINSNRNSATAATLVVAYDATSTADGTQIAIWRTGSGTTTPSRIGSEASRGQEIILKQNEDYFLKFTPDADNAKIKIHLSWYEHADIA